MTAAQVGAAGEIELDRDQKFGLRTGKVNKGDSVLLQGLDLVEDGGTRSQRDPTMKRGQSMPPGLLSTASRFP